MEGKKTNEIYGRGLDYIKKNTFGYAAEKQKELIEYILYKNPTKDDIEKWLKNVKSDFENRTFTKKDLIISQRVGRELESYKGTAPLHIRLAQQLKERTGENLTHREIEYVVTGNTGVMQGVLVEDFTGNYDKEYYWDNKTFPILDRITSVVFPNYDFFSKQSQLF
jgi:DNA polymerase elongation subunit (family B)